MVTCVPTAILGGNQTQVDRSVTGGLALMAAVPGVKSAVAKADIAVTANELNIDLNIVRRTPLRRADYPWPKHIA
jgi:hypothetical protein